MSDPNMHILSQPLMTEEGFINPACMNELEAAIRDMPPTHERLGGDPEWTRQFPLYVKDIVGYFANWSVRQLKSHPLPPNLETLIQYLSVCLNRDFKARLICENEPGFIRASLCEISERLHAILMGQPLFDIWNTKECLGDDWLDLHALLHNVCISLRDERRKNDAFDAKFDAEHPLEAYK